MPDRIEQSYLVARAIEESELAAVASTKTAMVAHMQMAAEYEERAGDFAAQLETSTGKPRGRSDHDETGAR